MWSQCHCATLRAIGTQSTLRGRRTNGRTAAAVGRTLRHRGRIFTNTNPAAGAGQPMDLSGSRVLVVDDVPANVDVLLMTLEARGIEVLVA